MATASQPLPHHQALFPPPPPFFKLYGCFSGSSGDEEPTCPPPPRPVQREYALFGEIHTTEDGIPPLTVRQLPPPPASEDVRSSLLALHRDLVVSVRDLLSLLTGCPSSYARALEGCGLIFRNMQHLTRVARPGQARAELVRLLERELEQREAAVKELRKAARDGKEALELGLGGVHAQLEKEGG